MPSRPPGLSAPSIPRRHPASVSRGGLLACGGPRSAHRPRRVRRKHRQTPPEWPICRLPAQQCLLARSWLWRVRKGPCAALVSAWRFTGPAAVVVVAVVIPGPLVRRGGSPTRPRQAPQRPAPGTTFRARAVGSHRRHLGRFSLCLQRFPQRRRNRRRRAIAVKPLFHRRLRRFLPGQVRVPLGVKPFSRLFDKGSQSCFPALARSVCMLACLSC